jgi:hypothetical protein
VFTCAQWGVGVRRRLAYLGEKVGILIHSSVIFSNMICNR